MRNKIGMRLYLAILLQMPIMLIQCKSYEFHVTPSGNNGEMNTPTLVVDSCINEHQYEGMESEQLKRVEITGKIKDVPQWAFAIVPTLEEVKLSSNVKTIKDNAFFSCKRLARINLNHVDTVGENSFKFSVIEEVNLAKAKIVKEFAFANCSRLCNVKFSPKLEIIEDFAFAGDTSLVDCYIPSGEVKSGAFMGCTKLERISFGKVVSIGKASFLDCVSIKSVVIPSTVREIEDEAFRGCEKLKEVTLMSRDTKIANDAFEKEVIITYKK